jgi:hypothetical protein
MAATVLVKDVLYRFGGLIHDLSPQFIRVPQVEAINWLNDAQVAITMFLPSACSRIDAVKLKAGTRQSIETIAAVDCKPGDGSTPATAIVGVQFLESFRNMGADGLTPGRVARVVPREDLDAFSAGWHTAANPNNRVDAVMYDPRFPRYFHVYPPIPASPAVWLEFGYTAQPLKVPNAGSEDYSAGGPSTEVIKIADQYLEMIVDYMVARAHMKETSWRDEGKAVAFTSKFVGGLNAIVTSLTGTNPNLQRLPFAPEPLGQAR